MPSKLLTPAEVAELLRCSKKTLTQYVRTGALAYIRVGAGAVRPRRMFTEEDVQSFIDRQAQREAPPQSSIGPKGRRSKGTVSSARVYTFTALRDAGVGATLTNSRDRKT
jgi:excisionase family DNA binding protein